LLIAFLEVFIFGDKHFSGCQVWCCINETSKKHPKTLCWQILEKMRLFWFKDFKSSIITIYGFWESSPKLLWYL